MIFGSVLISRLNFSKAKIVFQKKCGRRPTRTCLPSTFSLPLHPEIRYHPQKNSRVSPQKHSGVKPSLSPSPQVSSLRCSTDTTDGLAAESQLPDPATCPFLWDPYSWPLPTPDLWPSLTSDTCWKPEQSQFCLPTQQFPSSSQPAWGYSFVIGLGSQESKERRPWCCVILFSFFKALSSWVERTGPAFSTGPARTLSDRQSPYE